MKSTASSNWTAALLWNRRKRFVQMMAYRMVKALLLTNTMGASLTASVIKCFPFALNSMDQSERAQLPHSNSSGLWVCPGNICRLPAIGVAFITCVPNCNLQIRITMKMNPSTDLKTQSTNKETREKENEEKLTKNRFFSMSNDTNKTVRLSSDIGIHNAHGKKWGKCIYCN